MKKVENQELTLAYGIDRVEFEKLLYAAEKLSLENASKNEAFTRIRYSNRRKQKKSRYDHSQFKKHQRTRQKENGNKVCS